MSITFASTVTAPEGSGESRKSVLMVTENRLFSLWVLRRRSGATGKKRGIP